jgi:predicted  nucleic acid-binding Zn-ribbon protein
LIKSNFIEFKTLLKTLLNEKESLQSTIKLLSTSSDQSENKTSDNNENSNEISSLKQHIQSIIDSKNKIESQHQIERKTLTV